MAATNGLSTSLQAPAFHLTRPQAVNRSTVIFSGGSAANNLVDVFDLIAQQQGGTLSYVIPISDNGGSSSELIRVFGGPGIGDLRSESRLHTIL